MCIIWIDIEELQLEWLLYNAENLHYYKNGYIYIYSYNKNKIIKICRVSSFIYFINVLE